jgi:3-oxoacyl-[acyl-carrier-protein] synthase-3
VTITRSIALGCGSFLPEQILTNAEIAARIDTSDEWIVERTGIRKRHIARAGETTADLAVNAANRALENAGLSADAIDLVIVATSTPDETFPSVATRVQARIGMTRGAAFDVQAVCSGFIYGLSVADNFIRCGQAKTVLLIGAETFSRILDWNDRATCVLFGDGAGALILQAAAGGGKNSDQGILNTKIFSDGRLHDLLYTDGGVSSTQTTGHLRMQGREVFKHAVVNIADRSQARYPSRTGRHHCRRTRKHLGGVGTACPCHRCCRWPYQARGPCVDGSDGRRFYLGRSPDAVVEPIMQVIDIDGKCTFRLGSRH